jgi:integrase
LKAVFNFGIKRGYLEKNPVCRLDFEKIKNGEVVTLTPAQARALMTAASEGDARLLPYHALGLFAGIRPMELQRLDWSNIDLTEGHVEITAAVSKTGRRRIIDIEPNLKAWLARCAQTEGAVVTTASNLANRLSAIRHAAGIEDWPQDVMRHSYASYWLAEHGDINRLTLQLGHTSPTMLWQHYHRAATRRDAAKYWQIAPVAAGERKIVPITAA